MGWCNTPLNLDHWLSSTTAEIIKVLIAKSQEKYILLMQRKSPYFEEPVV